MSDGDARGISRRGALGGALAGAAGLAATRVAAAAGAGRRRKRKRDVIVVGAGLAGLSAARESPGRVARSSCSRRATGSAAAP